MTLIIGMKCKEGVFLVSDRKVIDENNNVTYEYKLQTLYGHIVGAAGYSHLFKKFNRKIKDIVDQRVKEVDLMNRKALKELDIPYPKEIKKEMKPKKLQSNTLREEKSTKKQVKEDDVQLPYIYRHEDFIEDCSELIRKLCCGYDESPKDMLDVLLVIQHEDDIKLHHIDFGGNEEEVDCYAIGSGSPFIQPFLKKYYKYKKSLADLISLAFFCVYYVQELKFDNFVGIKNNSIPDNLLLKNGDDNMRYFKFDNEKQIIKEIKRMANLFKDNLNSLNF